MSQHYAYPPPPASRLATAGSSSSSSGPSGRNRPVSARLPSISTASLTPPGPYSSTPPSATQQQQQQQHLPYTPSALNPRTTDGLPPQTPVMEPYNPRQWSSRGHVSGSQMLFQQRQANVPANAAQMTGMEAAMPSPPPPYSPATPENAHRAAVASPLMESVGFTASPPAESSLRPSPQAPMSPAFPPPPPQSSRHRERSASGLGGNRSFFSLSGLRGKQPAQAELQQPQQSNPAQAPMFVDARPPAARRAASTGHMPVGSSAASSATGSAGRDSPESRWQPGMPLPGPPPGPPPAGHRSQSLNRPAGVSGSGRTTPDAVVQVPRPRRAAAPPSSLGPVPPTPSNWEDDDARIVQQEQAPPVPSLPAADAQPLRIDTGSSRDSMLARRPAKRDTSAQGIRERRSRSRAAKTGEDESRPSDLVFLPTEGAISRRREHTRNISGLAGPSSAPSSASGPLPPSSKAPASVMTPPYTPAVGKSPVEYRKKQNVKVPGSASSDRPISHLLRTPNEDTGAMPAPLSPARPPTSGSGKAPSNLDAFSLQAIERHRSFIEKEAAAATDEERLELFANFIVHESRLRRDCYPAAYNAMAGDIMDLTRDMWRSYAGRSSRRVVTPSTSMSSMDPTMPSWASDGQPASAHANVPSSASSMGDFTPATDAGSVGDISEGFERHEGRQWADAFKPSLSPIPSMAVSTVADEHSSRGRTASRWWEASNSGSGSIGRPDRIEKSKRETKYMGVSPATLQFSNEDPAPRNPTPGASEPPYAYGPDEYPPEKVGWHEGHDFDTPMATPHRQGDRKASTPGIAPLDVSRLVTLPPPYPRHHPAISNSHPRLSDYRSVHRELADHAEVQKIKDSYMDQDFSLSREQQEGTKQRRARLRADIQRKIADGSMSFADAAKAEADFDVEEAERGKATARANFDVFEGSVSHPMNTLLTERLDKANDAMKQLRSDLESGHWSADPNRAQEEGDEHPERLEKLTLLKWIFEAREHLHKEMFDLHAMRSEKYSEVILTPYRISKAQAKMDEATTFFKKDGSERQVSFARDSLRRFEEFQILIEQNVSRGVEDQLSAFWDIAPGLLEVIQQIPSRMDGFEVEIPPQEFEENPSYHEHPLQYLYSLLNHAEKSAYQFIESQINLLCLLHEVRTATTKSRLRLGEIERNAASPNGRDLYADMAQAKRKVEDQLTADLKEKVGEVERQWQEALGDGMEECKERVSIWLEESGGLEDGMDG
ncbi:(R,R)-butanediol dehydrogenase [Lecanosticta acicola]|uniref:(R,R)-butanediol dehydrogenase n=1 Tax=Lecanosticta acicola TaxID=111012 RepID=A0AAI9EBU0_9PEZI|nr:(R,R)-butanediol dehydrogenase [Lecanosticta acicola]